MHLLIEFKTLGIDLDQQPIKLNLQFVQNVDMLGQLVKVKNVQHGERTAKIVESKFILQRFVARQKSNKTDAKSK